MAEFTYNLSYDGAAGVLNSLAIAANFLLREIEETKKMEETEYKQTILDIRKKEVEQIAAAYANVNLNESAWNIIGRLAKALDIPFTEPSIEMKNSKPPF